MSATFISRVSLELRQVFRQANFWVITVLAVFASGLVLRERVDYYLQMQSSGFNQLNVTNDVLAPVWGSIAALMLLCAPIIALSARAPWRLLHRRLHPSPAPLANTLAAVLALLLVLLLCVSTIAMLGSNAHWSWFEFAMAVLGLSLFSVTALLFCLNIAIRIEQTLFALAGCYGLLALLILLEWLGAKLPNSFFDVAEMGVFAQYRYLRIGHAQLGAISYFICLILIFLLALNSFIKTPVFAKPFAAILFVGALLSSQWQYRVADSVPQLSEAEQQVLQRYAANAHLTIVSSHPDERRDWEHQLKSLKSSQSTMQITSLHPEQLTAMERNQLPGLQGLMVSVGTQSTWLPLPSDQLLKRVVQAIAKLGQMTNTRIVFLEGHGERELFGDTPRDLGQLRRQIDDTGLTALALPLHAGMAIPDNTSVLVIASPQQAYPVAIRHAIMQYLMRGGHLLWLREPDEPETDNSTNNNSAMTDTHASPPFAGLEAYVGVHRLPGTILDLAGVKRGTPSPAIALVDHYAAHPSFMHLNDVSAFPWASALEIRASKDVEVTRLLQTNDEARLVNEQQLETPVEQLPKGPFVLGVLLEKKQPERTQRLAVVGDGHFLANAAIRNYGNNALAITLIQWLAFGEQALAPISEQAPQTILLDALALQYLRSGPMVLSALLLLIGTWVVWRWRRR